MNVCGKIFSNTRKRAQIHNRRQTRVLDDETAGASGNGVFVDGVGYGMVSTWVPLVQIETPSIGDNSGGSRSKNDP
eukprot:scaffold31764_cov35-Attheya_sp.AAC.2